MSSRGSRPQRRAAGGGGGWSLTGPYGSGKSSLVLLLDAVLGEANETRSSAQQLIDGASDVVGDLVRRAHRCHGTEHSGFHRGLVTAGREPLSHTVLRALHSAVLRRFGRIPSMEQFAASQTLLGALEDASTSDPRRTGPSPSGLVEIARCLASDAPLLLVIDEFGKNLEAVNDGGPADPYLLQQLAEAGQGSGLPIFLLTLQHLSFEDYLAGADDARRSEWAKVQGRFEDVAFVESAAETRALIGSVFDVADAGLRARIERWAKRHAEQLRALGIADLADPVVVAGCYPLHPLAAFVLPEMCNRYGQHERTLFSFLTSADPAGAAAFLGSTELPRRGSLPCLGLEAVYDYFVASGALSVNAPRQSTRWTEIAVRLRDCQGLTERQLHLAKAVALLNLVTTTGTVRASRSVLKLIDPNCSATLAELDDAGIVTYRGFADEYRIWNGTDVDVAGLLASAHQRVRQQSLVEILAAVDRPSPVVAARHSAENDVLRVFAMRYAQSPHGVEPLDAFSPYDGEVLLLVGEHETAPPLTGGTAGTAGAKPVVAAIPDDLAELAEAAREVAAVDAALDDPAIADDWVARRELGERSAQSRVAFEHARNTTFSAQNCTWFLLGENEEDAIELQGGRGSAALSEAADRSYRSTPVIGNEMLNRTSLTTQGSKARRILLEAMIERGSQTDLGLEGYGPEMSIYKAFLEHTGLHRRGRRGQGRTFCAPSDPSLLPGWCVLESHFKRAKSRRINLDDVYAALLSPPIGMKAAVIPVFVTAGLLAFAEEVAVYEHGTFKPLLTPEISERMVRNPGHFDIKHFANTSGARREVLDALAARLGVRASARGRRVSNVLAVVGHLVSAVRGLDNFTLRTGSLTAPARGTRDAVVAAVEPDELLFVTLPEALGFGSVASDLRTCAYAGAYADSVGGAIDELTGRYRRLLGDLLQRLLAENAQSSRLAVTGQAAALEDEILDGDVRAFVLTLANDSVDDDLDWISAVATVIAKKAPAEWNDDDLNRFLRSLAEQVASFQRLVALHTDQRAEGGGPFDALSVTITRSDGNEHVRLVSVDRSQRQHLERTLEGVLGEFADVTGSPQRANYALLALLAERLLPARHSVDSGLGTLADLDGKRLVHG
ncbi:MAG: hypothetical protein KTV16_06550 [Acidimicrobiia bacterium]|nr:hypothetical protein [Acidimicrobiia bacterium]